VNMMLNAKDLVVLAPTLILFVVMVLLSSSSSLSYGTETDIYCLRRIKDSLEDPYNYLNSSWDFNNNTEGFICKFTGDRLLAPGREQGFKYSAFGYGTKGPASSWD
jgi:hypothetical protein